MLIKNPKEFISQVIKGRGVKKPFASIGMDKGQVRALTIVILQNVVWSLGVLVKNMVSGVTSLLGELVENMVRGFTPASWECW